MPRAEVGSTKHIANQMKSKGLQRLRWYCQACSRQMRDENGFKCHVASESHVRQMQVIGEDPRRAINDFSNQFMRDFIQLLRTGHGEKPVNVNHFYQEYISNKEHVHMNATKWPSLTEFAKHLGREGICRVDEDEKNDGRAGAGGLTISWIDNSPEALRRQDALRKKDRQDRGDEEREQKMIREQIRRAARRQGLADDEQEVGQNEEGDDEEQRDGAAAGLPRKEGEKIVLNFAAKKTSSAAAATPPQAPTPPLSDKEDSSSDKEKDATTSTSTPQPLPLGSASPAPPSESSNNNNTKKQLIGISLGGASTKPKNVFAAATKKNAFAGPKKPSVSTTARPMSEAERIMKEEIERKRQRETNGFRPGANAFKKQRVS
jgi:DNA/RNA-binding protein KIN17